MPISANPVGPGQGQFGFAGTFSSAANGGTNQLIDVPAAFLQTLVEGSTVWVSSVRDSYVWYPLDTDAPDQLLIVKPTVIGAGAGRFVRNLIASPRWAAQLAWYIDPANVAANDENSGLDAAHPLKTDGERQRRMGDYPTWGAGVYHIHYISDVPGLDPVRIAGLLLSSATVYLHGSATPGSGKAVLYSGKIDARTAFVRATNTPNDITSNALPVSWTASGLVGARVRQTSGATSGAMAWIVKDLGAKKARTSQWLMQTTMTGVYSPSYYAGPSAATVNADIVVESLVAIHMMVVALDVPDDLSVHVPGYVGFVVDSIAVGIGKFGLGVLFNSVGSGFNPAFEGCYLLYGGAPAMLMAVNCRVDDMSINGGRCFVYGGFSNNGGVNSYGGCLGIDMDYMAQASSDVQQGGATTIGFACAFDKGSAGFKFVSPGTTLVGYPIWGGSGGLWGAGNGTYGMNVYSGNVVQMTSAAQSNSTVTGTSGELLVGNKASLPAYDVANHNYTADRALSWAQLVQTFAGGGFGNQVLNPGNGAAIVLLV